MTPSERALYGQVPAAARAGTDPATWAAAWAAGRATALEEAVAYALDDTEELPLRQRVA